jgi:hypothetical protein
LSDPLDLHSKHFINDLRVFVTLRDLSLRWIRLSYSHQGWLTPKSLYGPLLRGDLIVKTELDLGDCSERIRIERDLTHCEILNRDIGNLCG